jgi:calcineurin-like phosphoesterase family protein
MNQRLIDNWNSRVKQGDLVYHLGDFAWRDSRKIRHQLKGKIILILGNHDKDAMRNRDLFTEIHKIKEIKIPDNSITLCHFAMRTWNRSHFGSYHLHGHHHGNLKSIGKTHDVGVDNNFGFPISLDVIVELMKDKPENENDLRYQNRQNES